MKGIFWTQASRSWRELPHPDNPTAEGRRWDQRGWLLLEKQGPYPVTMLEMALTLNTVLPQVPCRVRYDRLVYPGYFGHPAWCGLLIERKAGRTTVTVTEPEAEDAGTSVTNRAEQLASWVCQAFDLRLPELRWIEKYERLPALPGIPREERDRMEKQREAGALVTFDWRRCCPGDSDGWELMSPRWQPVEGGAGVCSVRNLQAIPTSGSTPALSCSTPEAVA